MATHKSFAEYIANQAGENARLRAMFGEYGIYYNEKFVGLICDDSVFVKITSGTAQWLESNTEKGSPYPGAKEHYIITEDVVSKQDYFKQILQKASDDLPDISKKKSNRSSKNPKS
ncbi:MAG TPA: TfoX/Sxy family protein [Saprospiraceae bacterium]|nr:TfoX/Sxy family protein [Saprospiraceae bacterium]